MKGIKEGLLHFPVPYPLNSLLWRQSLLQVSFLYFQKYSEGLFLEREKGKLALIIILVLTRIGRLIAMKSQFEPQPQAGCMLILERTVIL